MKTCAHSRLVISAVGLVVALVVAVGDVSASQIQLVPPPPPAPTDPDPVPPPPTTIEVVGGREKVFDWTTDSCDPDDVPDLPARAFRDALGRVQLISTHYIARRFIGPNLNAIRHKCPVIMNSHMNSNPSKYDDHEWLASTYTLDGITIHALIHNEYQAYLYDPACNGDYFGCWYNSITSAISTDGGANYTHAVAPSHRVASIPYPYTSNTGPNGYFAPSNIIEKDGYYYAMIHATPYQAQRHGVCVMRTDNLADAASWRAWDGTGFNVRFISPYREPNEPPQDHVCAPVSFNNIQTMHESLTYNTHLGAYLLIGSAGKYDPVQQRVVHGVYYSLSDDLINWSSRQLVLETEFSWSYQCGDGDPIAYPVVLDPDSPTRNFETTGKRMYLYMTRLNYANCQMNLDRDLIRVPLEVFP